jgi:N-acetylneuraminic acid mutarotase
VERLTRRTAAAVALAVAAVVSGAGATTTTSPRGAAPAVRAADASWTLPAPVAREVVVPSGAHFTVVGGLDTGGTSTSAVTDVDPAKGATSPAGTLSLGVHDAAGVRAGRRILVFGGGTGETGTAEVQAVTAGAGSVVGALPEPRADLVAARVGKATYVFGGADGDTMLPGILRTTDGVTFTQVGTLPVPVRYPAVAVVGRAIYLFGGVSDPPRGVDTPAVQRFDTRRGVVDTVAQLPTSLSHASAVVLRGRVFVLGGYVDNSRLSDQVLRFDPATGASTPVGALPAPVSDAAAVVVRGRGYLVGGQGADRKPRATVTVVTAS